MVAVHTRRNCLLITIAVTMLAICVVISYRAIMTDQWHHPEIRLYEGLEAGKLTVEEKALVINKLVKIQDNVGTIIKENKNPLPMGAVRKTLDNVYELLNELIDKPTDKGKDNKGKDNIDVCQESFTPKSTDAGNTRIHNGFEMENCEDVPKFYSLITLLYSFVHYSQDDLARVPALLANVNKIYPNVKIIAAAPSTYTLKSADYKWTTVYSFSKSKTETSVWSYLISKVKTKYTYIGRNVVHFTWYERLERLVREINNLNAYVVGNAIKAFDSGKWEHGCERSSLQNYTLVYRSGYDRSMDECLVCDNMAGAFVTKTDLFNKLPLQPDMTGTSGFAVWFLTLKNSGKMSVVCPDAMSYVTESSLSQGRDLWKDLAKYINVEKIYPSKGPVLEFDCSEAGTSCIWSRLGKGYGVNLGKEDVGMALSHCCLRSLMKGTKLVLKHCKEAGLICELQEGTLLGALKFNGLLPWEIDSDITLEYDNNTAFSQLLKPILTNAGYHFQIFPKYYEVRSMDWFVEVFTQQRSGSVELLEQGITPTHVYYDGTYVATPISPGLYVRNRYGKEIYQHAQHWRNTGGTSGWVFYTAGMFLPCSKPGHSACLDQFVPDGNLQFRQTGL